MLTAHDIKHIVETWEGLTDPQALAPGVGPCGERFEAGPDGVATCGYPDCDCFESEIIMLSIGYVEVHADGKVISGGEQVYDCENHDDYEVTDGEE